MFGKLLLLLNTVSCFLICLIIPELKCFVSPTNTLSVTLGLQLGPFRAAALLVLLLGILPLAVFAVILIAFKRYIFSHYKSIRFSYTLIVELYLLSLSCTVFFLVFDFIMRLGFVKNYYFEIRIASLFPGRYNIHTKIFSTISTLLIQTILFIVMFFMVECYIAYKQHHLGRPMHHFIRRNRAAVALLCSVTMFYLIMLGAFEYNFHVFSQKNWAFILGSLGLVQYALCPNLAMLYIYLLIATNAL